MTPCILIVDDDEGILFACRRTFEREGYRTLAASDGRDGLDVIRTERPDVVFMDITMPHLDGLSALEAIKQEGIDVPVVIITGFGTMQTAIRAVQLGAYDYLTKPLDVDKVRTIARRALEYRSLQSEVSSLQARLNGQAGEGTLIGDHPLMQDVYKTIGAVTATPNDTPVLILGESGTGKELTARAVHRNGPGADAPFVPINCTALPAELLESELFGYERGAFTGATERRIGKFEVAAVGTIFLDEIGDLSSHLQQKLLRVIQEREFERLGGNEVLPVRARFVLATHRDLEAEVAAGRFREDLYFRISVVPIRLPPLRSRREDIPSLVQHLIQNLATKLNRRVQGVSDDAMAYLLSYDYPGNVRELENILERAIILSGAEIIDAGFLREGISTAPDGHGPVSTPISTENWREAREAAINAFEERFVRLALRRADGNVTSAARTAGLERQSLQRLMKKFGIRSKEYRSAARATAQVAPP